MKRKLSEGSIGSLKPAARPYEVHDAGQPGLLVRVQPSGVKSYVIQFARGKRLTLKPRPPSMTLQTARTFAREQLLEAGKSGVPTLYRPKVVPGAGPEVVTGLDFLEKRYSSLIADRKAHSATIASLKAQFGKESDSKLLIKPLAAISSWHVEQFKAKRLRDGSAPATVARDLDRLRAMLNAAIRLGLLQVNPVTAVKRIKFDNKQTRYLSPEEEEALRKALLERERQRRKQRDTANTRLKQRHNEPRPAWKRVEFTDHLAPLVLLAMNTGLRRGELLALTWQHVNFENRQLTVAAHTAKSGKVRHLPLNAEALDVLTRWKKQGDGSGLVFRNANGEAFTHTKRSWDSLVNAANVKNFRFHDLRHHFASRLAMSGVDLYTIKELLGHSDFALTSRYAHLAPEHNLAAVQKLDQKR